MTESIAACQCRASWKVKHDDLLLARRLISSKRFYMDDALAKIPGVHFFISCITGALSNSKAKDESQAVFKDSSYDDFYPGVSYFVGFTPNAECSPDIINACLYAQETDAEVTRICTRSNHGNDSTNEVNENMGKGLFQVVKDHNNPAVKRMVTESSQYCSAKQLAEDVQSLSKRERVKHFGDQQTIEAPDEPRLQLPCRIVIVNENDFGNALRKAAENLHRDGFEFFIDNLESKSASTIAIRDTPPSDFFNTIEKINKAMTMFKRPNVLYKGNIYVKPKQAKFTFIEMMDPESYLNKLMASEALREGILKHMNSLVKLMSNPECELFPQMKINFDLIEVDDLKFFSISQRKFIDCPLKNEDFRKVSPRMYIKYDSSKDPEPGYFKDGVLNSFPDLPERMKFLNKFYQCLMAHRMPHKTRKLVVYGPKDSGKTSWFHVFLGVIPMKFIASITSEKQFAASMITNDSELIFLDEWSEHTLQSDMAKTVLQGGFLTKAVKHQTGTCIINNSPFYITTNMLPKFGLEEENVNRRIECFETKSLESPVPGVDRWLRRNEMHSIAWIANEINDHRSMIDENELWYETLQVDDPDEIDFAQKGGGSLIDIEEIRNLRSTAVTSILALDIDKASNESPLTLIHENHVAEAKLQHEKAKEWLKHEENKNAEAVCMLLQNSSSDESDDGEMPPRGINSKKFHRKILEELKGNFYRPTLDHTHKMIAEQKLKTMKHLDEEHCAWLLVLGKTHKDFQHKLFL